MLILGGDDRCCFAVTGLGVPVNLSEIKLTKGAIFNA